MLCLLGRDLAWLSLADILALVWLERGWSGNGWARPIIGRAALRRGCEAGRHVPLINNQLSPCQPQPISLHQLTS